MSSAPESLAYGALRRELDGSRERRPVPADAFKVALRRFVSEPRLDMGGIATDLGVSKATVYRWTVSREQLLSEVLTFFSDQAFDTALAEHTGLTGVERLEAVSRSYLGQIVSFEPLARFVKNETRLALRLLTSRGGFVQQSVVGRTAALLDEEVERGTVTLRAPSEEIAYAITRVTEGYLYNDSIAELEPDLPAAVRIIRLLIS